MVKREKVGLMGKGVGRTFGPGRGRGTPLLFGIVHVSSLLKLPIHLIMLALIINITSTVSWNVNTAMVLMIWL